jgi:hypothetical protein
VSSDPGAGPTVGRNIRHPANGQIGCSNKEIIAPLQWRISFPRLLFVDWGNDVSKLVIICAVLLRRIVSAPFLETFLLTTCDRLKMKYILDVRVGPFPDLNSRLCSVGGRI